MPDYLIRTTIQNPSDKDSSPTVTRERIIRAKNEAQAIRHIIADTVTINRATLDDAIRVGKIETAIGALAGE